MWVIQLMENMQMHKTRIENGDDFVRTRNRGLWGDEARVI